jgi:hypothetical protein
LFDKIGDNYYNFETAVEDGITKEYFFDDLIFVVLSKSISEDFLYPGDLPLP